MFIICWTWQTHGQTDEWRLTPRLHSIVQQKNGNKTANINVKNFRGSLTTVVRAENDTSKTANITDTMFNRRCVDEIWFSDRFRLSEGSAINKYETGSSIERPRPPSWKMDMTLLFPQWLLRFGRHSVAWCRITCRLRRNGRDQNRK